MVSAWEGYLWIGLDKDIDRYRFWVFNMILNIWKDFKVLGRFIQKCLQPPASSAHALYGILSSYWLVHFCLIKNPQKCCIFLVWIAGCWNSSNILHMSHNPKNNYWLSRIFGAQFGGKDWCLCPDNPSAEKVVDLDGFLYEGAQNFKVFSNILD